MSSSFELLISAIAVSQNQGYSKAAALTFLACDILYTLRDEVKFIWRSKLSLTKILYCISRYFGIILVIVLDTKVGEPSNPTAKCLMSSPTCPYERSSCREYYRALTVEVAQAGNQLYLIIVDIICIMRIFALYNRNLKILALTMTATAVELGAGYYAVWRVTGFNGAQDPPRSELSDRYGCGFLLAPMTKDMLKMYTFKMSLSAANAVLFLVLSLYKLKSQLRLRRIRTDGDKKAGWIGQLESLSPLLVAFVRDGALTESAVVEALSATLALYRGAFYFTPLAPWLVVVFSYTGCRLILNIRRAGNIQNYETGDVSVPSIQFAKQTEEDVNSISLGTIERRTECDCTH
ncbi:hypothetical protein DFP72DRAFT_924266 [Ephemerocybe angulata]|uniref:DUF6533 domain-containing protein n=1 Tax=Ephemerocybe angulata TaxID=980116 RepID=A0A8H6LZ19_9AGAR|nr:hypothetical protein DFP72DRAFT_924266 [Tulosesus angulatus]